MKNFISNNKVFFTGLLAAITVALQQFMGKDAIDWKVVGFAVFMAALGFIANQWRGQGVTLLGIIGTLAGVFVTNYNGGHIDVSKLIMLALLAVLSAVAPPAKSQSYEEHPTIERAKDN